MEGLLFVTSGKNVGKVSILDINVPVSRAAMFAQGSRVVTNLDFWHKCAIHINVQWLKAMQSEVLVTSLPAFKVAKMHKVCEACQFGNSQKPHFLMTSM